MMTCKCIRKKLSAFLDGEVAQDEASRIERHLAICPACCDEARALATTYQLLERCPPALRPDVRSLNATEGPPLRRRFTLPTRSLRAAVSRASGLLAIVTGLLVGGLLGMWLWPWLSPRDSASPVLVGRRVSPLRELAAFGAPARNPMEEVYVTLTSGSGRSATGRR